jgi:hypothetical protein
MRPSIAAALAWGLLLLVAPSQCSYQIGEYIQAAQRDQFKQVRAPAARSQGDARRGWRSSVSRRPPRPRADTDALARPAGPLLPAVWQGQAGERPGRLHRRPAAQLRPRTAGAAPEHLWPRLPTHLQPLLDPRSRPLPQVALPLPKPKEFDHGRDDYKVMLSFAGGSVMAWLVCASSRRLASAWPGDGLQRPASSRSRSSGRAAEAPDPERPSPAPPAPPARLPARRRAVPDALADGDQQAGGGEAHPLHRRDAHALGGGAGGRERGGERRSTAQCALQRELADGILAACCAGCGLRAGSGVAPAPSGGRGLRRSPGRRPALAARAQVQPLPSQYFSKHRQLVEEFWNRTHWPKHVLVYYHFETENDVDFDRGLYVLLAFGGLGLLALALALALPWPLPPPLPPPLPRCRCCSRGCWPGKLGVLAAAGLWRLQPGVGWLPHQLAVHFAAAHWHAAPGPRPQAWPRWCSSASTCCAAPRASWRSSWRT